MPLSTSLPTFFFFLTEANNAKLFYNKCHLDESPEMWTLLILCKSIPPPFFFLFKKLFLDKINCRNLLRTSNLIFLLFLSRFSQFISSSLLNIELWIMPFYCCFVAHSTLNCRPGSWCQRVLSDVREICLDSQCISNWLFPSLRCSFHIRKFLH